MNKQLLLIIIVFLLTVSGIYIWAWHYDDDVNPDVYKPKYQRCKSGLYVRKNPHPCNRGDLIYIDKDVADKYCKEERIAEFDDAVYCQYNGFREDLAEITKDVYE